MSDIIDSFTGENDFLSNFSPVVIQYEDFIYSSLEHAYQAAKTIIITERELIHEAPTPGKAKRLGKTVTLRSNWEKIKLEVMEKLLRQKFQIPLLERKLTMTYPCELIEGNNWNDTYWGVCKGTGKNHLGKLLMKIREEKVLAQRIKNAAEKKRAE